jgi:enamine deaminase RidA (YjgF/YER057c/UK114 family)
MPEIKRFMPPAGGAAFPPFALAVRHGQTLYVSGLGPRDAAGRIPAGDFAAQFGIVLAQLARVLEAAGTDMRHLLKVNVLLTRTGDIAEMNRLYAAAFPADALPARTTCVVAALPMPDFLLEIECVAAIPG